MNSATLGALSGFFGALVTLGIPLLGFLYQTNKQASKAVRLLTGEEEVDGDGVLPRLAAVEERTERVEQALDRKGFDVVGGATDD